MTEELCEVKIVPHEIMGWKLHIKGCKKELEEIDASLQKVGRRYWHKRIEYVDTGPSASE